MKHELVEWMCMDYVIEWLCVQTLLRIELNFLFANFSFGMNMKRQRNPSCQEG